MPQKLYRVLEPGERILTGDEYDLGPSGWKPMIVLVGLRVIALDAGKYRRLVRTYAKRDWRRRIHIIKPPSR
jgi:hypothetical protein